MATSAANAATNGAMKSLSSAPALSRLFFLTEKNIAEGLISNYRRMALQGETVCSAYLGSKQMAVALHPETAKQIVTQPELFPKTGAREEYSPFAELSRVDNTWQPSLVTSNAEEWQKLRKSFNPAFALDALEKLIPMFCTEADTFIEQSKEQQQRGELEIVAATSHYALDCLGNALLGRPFGAQTGSFKETYASYLHVMQMLGDPLGNFFPWIYKFPLPRNQKVRDSVHVMKDLLEGAIQEKLEERARGERVMNADGSQSLLDSIIDSAEKDKDFPVKSIMPNLWVFFIAGHDTTATSLAWLINVFAQRPDIQAKVREEVVDAMGDMKTAPTLAQLDECVYLEAVLKENLRIHPPVHNLFTRLSAKDTVLGDYVVPSDTLMSIAISSINRHPDSWYDPDEFIPERFLTKEKRKHKLFSWMPFSVGPRRCIGDKFSIMEQKCLIGKLLLQYDIAPHEGQPTGNVELPLSTTSFAFFFKQPAPFSVRLQPRS